MKRKIKRDLTATKILEKQQGIRGVSQGQSNKCNGVLIPIKYVSTHCFSPPPRILQTALLRMELKVNHR